MPRNYQGRYPPVNGKLPREPTSLKVPSWTILSLSTSCMVSAKPLAPLARFPLYTTNALRTWPIFVSVLPRTIRVYRRPNTPNMELLLLILNFLDSMRTCNIGAKTELLGTSGCTSHNTLIYLYYPVQALLTSYHHLRLSQNLYEFRGTKGFCGADPFDPPFIWSKHWSKYDRIRQTPSVNGEYITLQFSTESNYTNNGDLILII